MTYRARTRAEIEWIKEYRARIGCSLREAAAALDAESHKPEPVDDMASLRAKLSQAEAGWKACAADLASETRRANAAEALAAEAVAVLREVEWNGMEWDGEAWNRACPVCGNEIFMSGHIKDCRLAAVLSRARSGLGGEGGERT